MTPFRFRLEQVLDWRRTQLELAEERFQRQNAAVAELDRARAALEAAGIRAEMAIRQWDAVTGSDLAALGAFRRDLRRRRNELDSQRAGRAPARWKSGVRRCWKRAAAAGCWSG